MGSRLFKTAEPHGHIVWRCAERDGAGGYEAVLHVIVVRDQAVACGGFVSAQGGQLPGPAQAAGGGQIPAPVFPGIQRPQGPALAVEIHNAVHLPGEAQGRRARHSLPQPLKHAGGLFKNVVRALLPGPGGSLQLFPAGRGQGAEQASALGIQYGPGDRGRAYVYAGCEQTAHLPLSSRNRAWTW